MTILEARGLSAGYGSTAVVSALNFTLRRGELVCLLGPNGAGKSTLIRTLCAMQKPLAGEVLLDGASIHHLNPRDLARKLSVVLTERVTIGILTAYELVSLGRYPHTDWTGRLAAHDHAIVRRSMEAVGADALAARNISELSDGERQKVMLARALAQDPSLMVLDEITAFLDLPRRVEIMRILRSLAHDYNRAILLSTHDLELALRTADRLWLLPKGGPLATGAPEDLVLSGAFEQAFASEGVDFDQVQGHFRLHNSFHAELHLDGDGPRALWTARALERQGFRVTRDNPSLPLRVELAEGEWRVYRHGACQPAATIECVIDCLVPHD
ncbi:MAG: ABC transporter ATP-binding protein [Acidobacteria bacterium]|nr:ABC transporter ATP-binding protein [Acidobacteriota bacterium]